MNGDGTITAADISIITGCIPSTCPCDITGDGSVTSQDFFDFLSCFFSPPMGC